MAPLSTVAARDSIDEAISKLLSLFGKDAAEGGGGEQEKRFKFLGSRQEELTTSEAGPALRLRNAFPHLRYSSYEYNQFSMEIECVGRAFQD